MEKSDLAELEALAIILRSLSPIIITYFQNYGQAPAAYTYLFDRLVARLLLLYKADPGVVAHALEASDEGMLSIIKQVVKEKEENEVPDTIDQVLEKFVNNPIPNNTKTEETDGDKLIDAYLEAKKKLKQVKPKIKRKTKDKNA